MPTEFESQVIDSLARLETHMETALDDLKDHNVRIGTLETWRNEESGARKYVHRTAIGALLLALTDLANHARHFLLGK